MLNKHKWWFHSSRVKFPLVSMSASWFLVSMYLIWILGCTLILSKNPSKATLWVLETCLIAGLIPFMIILITASLSSKIFNKASWREELTFWGNKINIIQIINHFMGFFCIWCLWGAARTSSGFVHGFLRAWLLWFVFSWRTVTITSHKSSAVYTVQSQSCVQRDDFWFCWTVRNWSLFLAHPSYWNKCMTFKTCTMFHLM